MNIIEVTNLTKTFSGINVIDNLSLSIKKGSIYGLLGPNGSGKTTLIRILLGILDYDKGEVIVIKKDMNNKEILKDIGYMPQQSSLYQDLTVFDNIKFFASIYNAEDNIDFILDLVELVQIKNKKVSRLSGGMKQRCSLACALVHKPKLLFLDEPTVGVDPLLRAQFWSYFDKISKENDTTIIVSSHVMDEAEHCDKLALMRFGKLIAEGSVSDLLKKTNSNNLENAFLSLSK